MRLGTLKLLKLFSFQKKKQINNKIKRLFSVAVSEIFENFCTSHDGVKTTCDPCKFSTALISNLSVSRTELQANWRFPVKLARLAVRNFC